VLLLPPDSEKNHPAGVVEDVPVEERELKFSVKGVRFVS
jgi:hypothetical protein